MAKVNVNKDGYYDDVLPVDYYESKKQKLDPDMVKKILFGSIGVIAFLVLCIVVLTLM